MSNKPQRRQRYEGLSVEQTAQQLSDDLDLIEAVQQEHIQEDEEAFAAIAQQWQEWKLTSLRFQNKQLIALAFVLLTAMVSIVVALATRSA